MEQILMRTYSELSNLRTFEDRFKYLELQGEVGTATFGWERYLNQLLYHDPEWKRIRNKVIVRDLGHDLGMIPYEYEISGLIFVHHMNPITAEDIRDRRDYVLDPEFLICCSLDTHNAIHYGTDYLSRRTFLERAPNDTCPWKKGD